MTDRQTDVTESIITADAIEGGKNTATHIYAHNRLNGNIAG